MTRASWCWRLRTPRKRRGKNAIQKAQCGSERDQMADAVRSSYDSSQRRKNPQQRARQRPCSDLAELTLSLRARLSSKQMRPLRTHITTPSSGSLSGGAALSCNCPACYHAWSTRALSALTQRNITHRLTIIHAGERAEPFTQIVMVIAQRAA